MDEIGCTEHTSRFEAGYSSKLGKMIPGRIEDVLESQELLDLRGKVQLIFTSPPFPLNAKKKYGNLKGDDYRHWFASLAQSFAKLLTPDGSIVIELGNSWEPGRPVMSTLPLKSLLAFQEAANLNLCESFIWNNTAKLPSPAAWVTVNRFRAKDAYTNIWWMSPSDFPKANNTRVLTPYTKSMMQLLERQKYNSGKRPSEHGISSESFLVDHGGAIPSNVLSLANTSSRDEYHRYCLANDIVRHPARMPKGIAEFFVKFLTEPGDLVLDPFAGSNTTGAVCEVLKRRWLSVEPEIDYIRGSVGRFDISTLRHSGK